MDQQLPEQVEADGNRGMPQLYDVAPLHLGPLQTSALVPVLLGVFYAALVGTHLQHL